MNPLKNPEPGLIKYRFDLCARNKKTSLLSAVSDDHLEICPVGKRARYGKDTFHCGADAETDGALESYAVTAEFNKPYLKIIVSALYLQLKIFPIYFGKGITFFFPAFLHHHRIFEPSPFTQNPGAQTKPLSISHICSVTVIKYHSIPVNASLRYASGGSDI